jgi:hypothetical protein
MIRIKNINEVKQKFNGIIHATKEIENSVGKDIVEKVKNTIKPEGPKISKESEIGKPREALFEATYRGEMAGEKLNAEKAKSEMNKIELDKNEEEIINRFIRDFLADVLREI